MASLWVPLHVTVPFVRRAGIVVTVAVLLLLALHRASARSPADPLLDMGLDRVTVLPEYCEYSQDGKYGFNFDNLTPDHRRWLAVIGPTMHHIHHYCRGLKAAQKAQDPFISPQLRASLYNSVVKESTYVIERAPPDFVLLPEIYLRMGQAMFGMGDVGTALAYFEKSRRAKPEYWPAYVEIARTNLSFGRRDDAIAALQAGLRASPDEAHLKQALERVSTQAPRARPTRGK